MPRNKGRQSHEEKGMRYIVTKIAIGGTVGIILMFAIFSIASAIILKHPIEQKLYSIASLISIVMSAFISGFIASRPIGKNGIMMGLLAGSILSIAICIAVLATSHTIGIMTAVAVGAALIGSSAGGILAVNLKRKK